MAHDLKQHYDGYDAKCRKCGATYRAFCCMNVGEMCNKCFQHAFAALTEAEKQKRLTPPGRSEGALRKLATR